MKEKVERRKLAVPVGLLLAAFMYGSCATRIVSVPEYHEVVAHSRDTLAVRDSVFVHDSVMVTLRGDTVMVEKFNIVYRDRWRDRLRTDSFIRRDTVTVVREVEKSPGLWRKARDRLSTVIWVLAAAASILLLARVIIIMYRYWRG